MCSLDWTCNLQMILLMITFQPNTFSTVPCTLLDTKAQLSLRFSVSCRVQHETPEEGQRIYRPKPCEYNKEDKDNHLNILSGVSKIFSFLQFFILNFISCTKSKDLLLLVVVIVMILLALLLLLLLDRG